MQLKKQRPPFYPLLLHHLELQRRGKPLLDRPNRQHEAGLA